MDHFQTVGYLKWYSLEVYINFFGGQKGGSLELPRTPPAYGPVPALLSMVSVAEVDVEGQNSHIWQEIILAVTHTPCMNLCSFHQTKHNPFLKQKWDLA